MTFSSSFSSSSLPLFSEEDQDTCPALVEPLAPVILVAAQAAVVVRAVVPAAPVTAAEIVAATLVVVGSCLVDASTVVSVAAAV